MIYGATGYTGTLFAKHLRAAGITPLLAGRSDRTIGLGRELGCPSRVFSIQEAAGHLSDVDFLVNLAGPFTLTQGPLVEACIATQTHYLDIAGEAPEVEAAWKYHDEAADAGIYILPAAGFGVVPTDIAAKLAANAIAAPTHLTITYATEGGASRGTLKTVLKEIHRPGRELVAGRVVEAKPAKSERTVSVFSNSIKAVYNPWRADLFTAHRSTGVANVATYTQFPSPIVRMMRGGLGWARKLLLNYIVNWLPEGPSEKQLGKGHTLVYAEAANAAGQSASVELMGPEAYIFTVHCLERMLRLLDAFDGPPGCMTPSSLGTAWLAEMEGVDLKLAGPQVQ